MTPGEARTRLQGLGLGGDAVDALMAHFEDAERRGKQGHGFQRVAWLETVGFEPSARPERLVAEEGFERWAGRGALGYLVLEAIVRATLASPPRHARVVVAEHCFPSGVLGYWVRRLAEGGLVAALTATSPRRLPHPAGGPPLTGTNPLAIAIPSTTGQPVVTDVSMGAVTHGDVLEGRARPEELVPFGGEQAHKAFALAVGLQLLVEWCRPAVTACREVRALEPSAFRGQAVRRSACGARPARLDRSRPSRRRALRGSPPQPSLRGGRSRGRRGGPRSPSAVRRPPRSISGAASFRRAARGC
ncbi:MAG: Ldh family oxidoreductase [Actinobacteria bacterium]|nr:MAG: Ldh family oxidoreductase [Actinomycetota bacterium]